MAAHWCMNALLSLDVCFSEVSSMERVFKYMKTTLQKTYGKASYTVAFTKYHGIARAQRLRDKKINDYQYRGIARAMRKNRPT